MQGVDDGCQHYYGSAVLVIVEHGNPQVLEAFFNLKAAGRGYVFQVDAAETWGQVAHRLDYRGVVLGAQADGKGVHISQALEQDGLALHYRQGRLRADVAQAQHRGSVGYYRHGIAPVGQRVAFRLVFIYGQAHRRHAGSVGNGKSSIVSTFILEAMLILPRLARWRLMASTP